MKVEPIKLKMLMNVRQLLQSVVIWFSGAGIGALITKTVMKIGWENKEQILIYGYAALASLTGWMWTVLNRIRAKEMEALEDKIVKLERALERKAEKDDLERLRDDIKVIGHKIDELYKYLLEK